MNTLYFLGAIFIIYILLMARYYIFHKKARNLISNIDKEQEQKEAANVISEFSMQNESILTEVFNINAVDAYTYGEIRYIQAASENQIEQLAGISMLKINLLYDYVMLKDTSLCIYDNEHNEYVFVQDLNNVGLTIEELPLDRGASMLKYYLPFTLKRYKLKADVTDKLSVEIVLHNCLNYSATYPGKGLDAFKTVMKDCSQQHLNNYRMGNYFLKRLKDACPTASGIPTCFD